ncbi:uncharacterized protein J3R85_015945 [Psidium guajava]|nr:uncharacterized protein J3R85_015945 [Psidium guajava]
MTWAGPFATIAASPWRLAHQTCLAFGLKVNLSRANHSSWLEKMMGETLSTPSFVFN